MESTVRRTARLAGMRGVVSLAWRDGEVRGKDVANGWNDGL
jgi:hypothetical protein